MSVDEVFNITSNDEIISGMSLKIRDYFFYSIVGGDSVDVKDI